MRSRKDVQSSSTPSAAPVDAFQGADRVRPVHLEVVADKVQGLLDLFRVEQIVDPTHHLHVLLRHRLLRSPAASRASCHRRKPRMRTILRSRTRKWTANSWSSSNVAGASLQLGASQPHNRVLQIAKLAFLDAKHLPSLPSRSESAGDVVTASVHGAFDGGRTRGLPFDLGIESLGHGCQVPPVEGFNDLPHDLHVLLRHRLLRSPAASRASAGFVEPRVPHDLAVPQGPQGRLPTLHLDAAASSACPIPDHHRHLITHGLELFRLRLPGLPSPRGPFRRLW